MIKKWIILIAVVSVITSCETGSKKSTPGPDQKSGKDSSADAMIAKENKKFLEKDKNASELFRVLLTSDEYIVSQMRFEDFIKRDEDKGGDKYMSEEIKKLGKIDEVREGEIAIWLYPDSGRVMKIRPQRPTYLLEVDKLLNDDIQRWNFKFPKKIVEPTKFEIRYRVILKKTQTDDEILQEVRQKMKDSQ
jgi:hypothetical protein